MYRVKITFNNGSEKYLRITRAKMAVLDEYFNANVGVSEVKVVEAENDKPLTVENVERLLRMNGWEETVIVCPDGARVSVTPCGYGDITKLSDCDYFLVHGDMPWMGGDKLEKVVDELNRHAELLAEQEAQKKKLREYFEAGQADGWTKHDWSWYSDWHKDLYGYRPHGYVCGEYVNPHRI